MEPHAVRDRAEVMRDEWVMRDKIVAALTDGPKTVPEIAEALGQPLPEVMLWVMAMRRYGAVAEKGRPDEDGYFHYQLAGEKTS
jgi:predicted Rossmann fold nucleotide-binding protein DprA/Smf involved in DNA uptake